MNKHINNKGITMGRLVLRLIIIGTLIVVLVPLGYKLLNKYKDSELKDRAKTVLYGLQNQLNTVYNTAPKVNTEGHPYTAYDAINGEHEGLGAGFIEKIAESAGVPDDGGFYYMMAEKEAAPGPKTQNSWKIKYFMYYEGLRAVYYDGEQWMEDITFTKARNIIKFVHEDTGIRHGKYLYHYPEY